MAEAVHCFTPIQGKRIRVTELDSCGNLPTAGTADSFIVTDGFITVKLSAEVENGAEIIQKNASGALCVNERLNDSFKRFNVEITFCGVNPYLVTMMTMAEPYYDAAGEVNGYTVKEGEYNKAFSFELWTGLAGQGACSGGGEASGYILLPFVKAGVPGDIEIGGENAVNFTLTGAYTKGNNTWGVGPYKVAMDATPEADFLPTALDDMDHMLLMDTAVAPPPAACNPQPMPTAGTTTTTTTAA